MLEGHGGEISKVAFNPPGTRVLTASSDRTCRLWDVDTGQCLQVGRGLVVGLAGHKRESFTAFLARISSCMSSRHYVTIKHGVNGIGSGGEVCRNLD